MTSQMESFSCNLVERILFPNSETSRPPRNFTAAITQAITLCPGELACFYECRAVAGGQLSSDVMEKWYLKILGPISEIKEQQNIHSILVLRNACGGGFPNYSLFVHFCVTTYHLVSTRFFWDLKKKKSLSALPGECPQAVLGRKSSSRKPSEQHCRSVLIQKSHFYLFEKAIDQTKQVEGPLRVPSSLPQCLLQASSAAGCAEPEASCLVPVCQASGVEDIDSASEAGSFLSCLFTVDGIVLIFN